MIGGASDSPHSQHSPHSHPSEAPRALDSSPHAGRHRHQLRPLYARFADAASPYARQRCGRGKFSHSDACAGSRCHLEMAKPLKSVGRVSAQHLPSRQYRCAGQQTRGELRTCTAPLLRTLRAAACHSTFAPVDEQLCALLSRVRQCDSSVAAAFLRSADALLRSLEHDYLHGCKCK